MVCIIDTKVKFLHFSTPMSIDIREFECFCRSCLIKMSVLTSCLIFTTLLHNTHQVFYGVHHVHHVQIRKILLELPDLDLCHLPVRYTNKWFSINSVSNLCRNKHLHEKDIQQCATTEGQLVTIYIQSILLRKREWCSYAWIA